MKSINNFSLSCFFFFFINASAQNIAVGIQVGCVAPFKKIDYLNQSSSLITYPNIPSVSSEISLSVRLKKQNQILIYAATYVQQVSAKFKKDGRVIQSTHGSSNINYGIKYYFKNTILNTNREKWINSYIVGLNFENNVNRYVNFPSGSSKIYLYNFKRKTGIYPQAQFGYSIERKFKRTSVCFDLFGNLGFKHNMYFYFSSTFDNEIHKAIVKRKGDFLSFAVRYNYRIYRRKT